MLLSDTWLKPSTPSRLVTIPGYTLTRVDRPDCRGYGGVAALIKVGIAAAPLKVPIDRVPESKLEALWMLVKLEGGGRQLIIGSLYRPPRHTASAIEADFTDLEAQVERLTISHPKGTIIICGDLNCDMLKDPPSLARFRFGEFLNVYSLHQIVKSPTYSSGSLLDVCIVKKCEDVAGVKN